MLAEVAYLAISVLSWSLNEAAREVSLAATSVLGLAGATGGLIARVRRS